MGIHGHLEVPKQAGRVWHLVDNDRRRMALQEALRLLFGLLGFGREVEGDKRIIRKEMQKGGGLAGLPGPGQHDHWPRPRRVFQVSLNIARNPHMQDIRHNRIFCI